MEKKEALAREHGQAVDVVAKLDQNEDLLWLVDNKAQAAKDRLRAIEEWEKAIKDWPKATNEWAKVIEERAISITTWAVKEYKDSDNFVVDAIAEKSAYVFGFEDRKKMIAKAFSTSDLHGITTFGVEGAA